MPRKETRRKERRRVKPPTSTLAIEALIGEEENGKQKKELKKETESGSLTQLPWIIQWLLTTHMDHTTGLFLLIGNRERRNRE